MVKNVALDLIKKQFVLRSCKDPFTGTSGYSIFDVYQTDGLMSFVYVNKEDAIEALKEWIEGVYDCLPPEEKTHGNRS
jgi:hypothetical protein